MRFFLLVALKKERLRFVAAENAKINVEQVNGQHNTSNEKKKKTFYATKKNEKFGSNLDGNDRSSRAWAFVS
jgi:hypothetical protein